MKTETQFAPIAYSPRAAGKAFVPPISERRIRDLIRGGTLPGHMVGVRSFVLRDDLVAAVRQLPAKKR